MTKSTRDVSTCFVFKSSPEAFISPVFQKFFYPGRGAMPPSQTFPPPVRERCSLTLFGLHLDFYLATPLMPMQEAVCTIFMMVFGVTRPRGELMTYRARGGHATD